MRDQADIVRDFVVESQLNVDQLGRELVELVGCTSSDQPRQKEIVARAVRTMHTLNGTSGFLEFSQLQAVSEAGETLLCHVRDRQIALTPEVVEALKEVVALVGKILRQIETHGNEGEGNHRQVVAGIIRLLAASNKGAVAAKVSAEKSMMAKAAARGVAK